MGRFVVLATDLPGPDARLEAGLLAAIGARLVVAETGSEPELLELVTSVDAILTCFGHVTPAVVRAGKQLRIIGRYGVGVDNIAVDVATELGIPVTNVPDYCVGEVAEHTIALLLTLARRTSKYDAAVRMGNWAIEAGMPLHRIRGSILGVIGFGHIGQAVASLARGLGMRVLVTSRSTRLRDIRAAGCEPADLDRLLKQSDVVSIHVPLTVQTRGLIDTQRLALMKRGAFLLNCARGAVVDLEALAAAIREGRLAGAGLDVFEPERLPSGHPLLALSNVVLTPHVAFYSEESIAELQQRATENVVAALTGQALANVVNPEVLKAQP